MDDTAHSTPHADASSPMSGARKAAWIGAVLLLLLPLIAMYLGVPGIDWTGSDFVVAGVLLFGSLGAYEAVVRTRRDSAYRIGVALAIATTFLLLWSNGAVSITDSSADGLFLLAALVGIVGIVVALVRPAGGMWLVGGAAVSVALSCIATLATGAVPNPYVPTLELLGITGLFVTLYGASAWLLHESVREAEGQPVS
jgi:hypothetical protein